MRMIDADSLESKLPAHSNDSDHVMTRNFAVESFRALIKAEPTVTPSPVYAKSVLLDRAVGYDLQNAFPKALLNLRLERSLEIWQLSKRGPVSKHGCNFRR